MMNPVDYKLETMPGIGLVTAASFVAEIGDITRFASADKLARLAGIAPTAFGSGENGGRGGNHKKCKQGNRVLHELFYQLTVEQVHKTKRGDEAESVSLRVSQGKTKAGKNHWTGHDIRRASTGQHNIWRNEDKGGVRSARATRDKGKLIQLGTGTALQQGVRGKLEGLRELEQVSHPNNQSPLISSCPLMVRRFDSQGCHRPSSHGHRRGFFVHEWVRWFWL
jgi:hypothetical protein